MKKIISKRRTNNHAAISAAALGRALVCAAAFGTNPQPTMRATTALHYKSGGDYGWPTTGQLVSFDEPSLESGVSSPDRGDEVLRKSSRGTTMMPAALAVPSSDNAAGSAQLDEYIAYCERRHRHRVAGRDSSPSPETSPGLAGRAGDDLRTRRLGSGAEASAAARVAAARLPPAVAPPSSRMNRLRHFLVCLVMCWSTAMRGIMSAAFGIVFKVAKAALVRSGFKQGSTALVPLAAIAFLVVIRPLVSRQG